MLTECPERWTDVPAEITTRGEGGADAQLAVGAWPTVFGLGPAEEERVRALLKHVREAGCTRAWTRAGAAVYEEAATGAVVARGALRRCRANGVAALRASTGAHIRATCWARRWSPDDAGGADLYQAHERRVPALVDPDNRRTVRFADAGSDG
ncbi:hypothetical protein GCM10023238_07220 [Streptomyces heliomycini]